MADVLGQSLGTMKDLLRFLTERSKSKDIIKNALLRELRDNLQVLQHRNNSEVNLLAIIEALSAASIEEAYSNNYKFQSLAKGKSVLEAYIIADRQKKYVGWNEERLMSSIEGKIRELKRLPALYENVFESPVNVSVRLDNLYYQLVLMSTFIYKSR